MDNRGEEGYFVVCLGYFSLALAQVALLVLASALHNDMKPEQRGRSKHYQLGTEVIGGLSLLLIIVEFYISIVCTVAQGPKIIIVWLAIAQLMTTMYYLYIPLVFLNETEEDEWFMVDEEGLEDPEERVFPEKSESAFSNGHKRASMYGTLEFSQMPGPGAASPI